MPESLAPLLNHVPAWLLVLVRLSGIFLLGPVFGSSTVPARIRMLLAVGLSFCVYPTLLTPSQPAVLNVLPVVEHGLHLWKLGALVGGELLIGAVIGFGASLPLVGMQIGGHYADQQLGLGIAGVFNPEMNEQAGVLSEFYFMLALAIFVSLGGHQVVLATLVGSFSKVPLGGFVPDGHLLTLLTGLLGTMMELGLRVAAPLLVLVFMETVAMGFIMRTVPQMNILSIGFALRIMAGTSILIAAIAVEGQVFREVLLQMMRRMMVFFSL